MVAAGGAYAADEQYANTFNDADQLAEVTPDGSPVAGFAYDGDGLRVMKESGGTKIFYPRDVSGSVIAEYDQSGNVLAEHVHSDSWGTVRAYLEPAEPSHMPVRFPDDRFYVPNSNKGFTHGCVETSTGAFNMLLQYREDHPDEQTFSFLVNYSDPTTRGATGGAVYPELSVD
jgi:hypothetical protein